MTITNMMTTTMMSTTMMTITNHNHQVDMLDPVTANFLGDNLRCWMQIQVTLFNTKPPQMCTNANIHLQVGKGPYASEVSGIVKIGQTMTMVLGVKDDENKFDMMVSWSTSTST